MSGGDADTNNKLEAIPEVEPKNCFLKFKNGETADLNSHHFRLSGFLSDFAKAMDFEGSEKHPIDVQYDKKLWDVLNSIIETMREKYPSDYLQFLNHEDNPQELKPEYAKILDGKSDILVDCANMSAFMTLNLTKRVIISRLKNMLSDDPKENRKLLRLTPLDAATCERENIGMNSDIWSGFPTLYKEIFGKEYVQ